MQTKIIAFIFSLMAFLLVVELVRREKLTFKYAFAWMTMAVLGIVFSVFDQILYKIADCFGFELTSNFIFFIILSFFVFLSLLLTTFLCQQNNRNDTIAQKIGILELELSKLKEELQDRPSEKDQLPRNKMQ